MTQDNQEQGNERTEGAAEDAQHTSEAPGDGDEARRRGFRQGMGILSAFKEALEETINEARDRGDLSTDRAREAIRGAMSRAREAAGEAKERLDFATEQELRSLRETVDELKVRLENLERRASQDPDAGPVSGTADDE